ncbi:RNA-binding domain-containing protein [Westerdykella ornata]|uniref:RNA-binding domain-containing protein n=1 Tax=Westerdykella ornata TaxID=318751 RepID=A0A6A6JFN0_WESOR|nr:RNA-binding domain-containing protein [Westerdykella ornata]KAF2274963.1 RNA-binding domain-containing protein [Westerdykella ornata]
MSKTETPTQEDAWAIRKEERRKRKELKEKQKREKGNAEGDAKKSDSKKRKREALPEELEIKVDLPEPPSKKELRNAKKLKENSKSAASESISREPSAKKPKTDNNEEEQKAGKRSEYGVWIGNLPWSATKETLRKFLTENSDITNEQITRVNMPAPTKPPNPNWTTKPLNKGFAYVDFSDQLSMYSAIALTETKMDGRPLLIKNAKSFEGRPEKPKTDETAESGKKGKEGKPPNKRVFVGNLAFDVTKEDLTQHFSQCGDIADIHMATFEDSGKCKGYAWITFESIDSAASAVKGFIYKESAKDDADESEEEGAGKSKKVKWFVNRLMGRDLRCEFAEDSTTRYNKRYGKEKQADMEGVHPERIRRLGGEDRPQRGRQGKQPREKGPRGKVDSRSIKSGAAHTNAPRGPQGIVEARGTKITFD